MPVEPVPDRGARDVSRRVPRGAHVRRYLHRDLPHPIADGVLPHEGIAESDTGECRAKSSNRLAEQSEVLLSQQHPQRRGVDLRAEAWVGLRSSEDGADHDSGLAVVEGEHQVTAGSQEPKRPVWHRDGRDLPGAPEIVADDDTVEAEITAEHALHDG